jgi:hypothetical protein
MGTDIEHHHMQTGYPIKKYDTNALVYVWNHHLYSQPNRDMKACRIKSTQV